MGYLETISAMQGLTHYYPLNDTYQARDAVGGLNGTTSGNPTFATNGATFDGNDYITIADHSDFSIPTTGELTIVVFQTVNNWAGVPSSGYIHWMGKGVSGQHEWVLRHYPASDSTRPKRTSAYAFNLSGGLGAGSYFQDDDATGVERFIVVRFDNTTTSGYPNTSSTYPGLVQMFKNAVLRDSDGFHNYSLDPENGTAPVRIGTRDTQSFLIGRVRRVAFFNRKITQSEIDTLYAARNDVESSGPEPEPEPDPGGGDGVINIVGSVDELATSTTSQVVATPAGTEAGDVLLGFIFADADTSGSEALPAGFTEKAASVKSGTSFPLATVGYLRLAAAPAASYTFTTNSGANNWCVLVTLSGVVASGDPFDVAPSFQTQTPPSTTSHTLSGITPPDGSQAFAIYAQDTGGISGISYTAAPSGWSSTISSPGGAGGSSWISYLISSLAGTGAATGDLTATVSSTSGRGRVGAAFSIAAEPGDAPAANPSLSTLEGISTTQWSAHGGATIGNNQASLPTNAYGLLANAITTRTAYSLATDGDAIQLRVPDYPLATSVSGSEAYLYVELTTDVNVAEGNRLAFRQYQGFGDTTRQAWEARYTTGGVNSAFVDLAAGQYIRFERSGTDVLWRTSPDGVTWTTGQTTPVGSLPALTDLFVRIRSGGSSDVSGSNWVVSEVNETVTPPAGGKLATFTDSFNRTSLGSDWSAGPNVSLANNQLRIAPAEVTTRSAGRAVSAATYDLTESSVTIEMLSPVAAANTETMLRVIFGTDPTISNNNIVEFFVHSSPSQLVARVRPAGATGIQPGDVQAAFTNAHRWLRIRETAGQLYWETAPAPAVGEAPSWTVFRGPTATPWDATAVRIALECARWA